MIKKVLENIIYTYYPKGICNIEQKERYLNSVEYIRLSNLINDFTHNEDLVYSKDLLISELKKNDFFTDIRDVSLLSWQDRCFSFEVDIFEANILKKLCLNVSLLVPYYAVYVLHNKVQLNPYKWITLPKRNRMLEESEFKEKIDLLCSIVERITLFNKFPDELANVVVPDIGFKDNSIGSFTFYNAFFLDDNK